MNKQLVCAAFFALIMYNGYSQSNADKERESKIAATQGGATPLFFDPNTDNIPLITPGTYYNEQECNVRGGLPNVMAKLKAGKPVTIGYIGGSITQGMYCYRTQSAKYLQSLYPSVNMKWINAGVSGTGTDLGACRLYDQMLKYHPDLVFVEFAVNGAYQNGMEGIIRQVYKNNPNTDVCLIYTIFNGQTKVYQEGRIPENITGLEKIAAQYQLPSIHLGMEAAQLEKEDKLVWKGDTKATSDKIIFSADGIHPVTAGGNLYAAAIARSWNKIQQQGIATATKHVLPAPLIADNWEDAKMYAPQDIATFDRQWTKLDSKETANIKQFYGWFPYVMQAEQPGSSFTFKFKGSMFGFFDIGGPETGQLSVQLDGKPVRLQEISAKGYHLYKAIDTSGNDVINRFNNFCNNRYRGQYEFIETTPGVHTVTISIAAQKADKRKILGEKQLADITEHPEKYDRTAIYIGKILLRGEIIK